MVPFPFYTASKNVLYVLCNAKKSLLLALCAFLGLRLRRAAPGHLGPLLVPGHLVPREQLRARGLRARLLRAGDLRARPAVPPSPATQAIWTGLKAGEPVCLISRV